MATSKNTSTSTTTITDDAGKQLREIADQLDVFSEVIASAFEATAGGLGDDARTVAAFAISRIGAELAGFSASIYSLTGKGGAA